MEAQLNGSLDLINISILGERCGLRDFFYTCCHSCTMAPVILLFRLPISPHHHQQLVIRRDTHCSFDLHFSNN